MTGTSDLNKELRQTKWGQTPFAFFL